MPNLNEIYQVSLMLQTLESRVNRKETPSQDDFLAVQNYLTSTGFIPSDSQVKKFYYLRNKIFPDKEKEATRYFGSADNTPFQVRVIGNNLFLIQPYRHKVSMSWRFDSEGKIRQVDFKIKNPNNFHSPSTYSKQANGEVHRLVFINDNFTGRIGNLPHELDCVDPRFISMSQEEKGTKIIEYGHNSAGKLDYCIRNNLFGENHLHLHARDNQRPLKNIVGDIFAKEILRQAASRRPKVEFDTFPFFYLNYY